MTWKLTFKGKLSTSFFNRLSQVVNDADYICAMMSFKRILDFYIQSSLHVSLCFVAFYTVVSLEMGFAPSMLELVAVGCSTLVGYNIAKYVHLLKENFQFNVAIKILTGVSALIAVIAVFQLGVYAVILFGVCSILTALYSLPEIIGKSFRQIPVVKLITIGVSWSVLAVLLPHIMYENGNYFKTHSAFHFISSPDYQELVSAVLKYALFVIALCIPFEIRDLKYDAPELRTLPQLIGVEKTKYVGIFLLLIYGAMELENYGDQQLTVILTGCILTLTALSIWFADRFKSDYYASLFVEAIPILWLGLFVVFGI
ncbi:UbiA prenyltransferase family protein [Nonlabens marinus]|uniref:Uncharacterized protein n=1 Tax=Nonlabens marinus S1-08 TaxID=1454201 RepID=W8VXH5_9FLAO|nr:hypothetical protein [Nonlabens marinus]BAO55937.1 hypothetical protein NMS_1928 [Nonlabens marinus S1-08]